MPGPFVDAPRPSRPTYEGRALPHPDEPVFDQGLAFDVDDAPQPPPGPARARLRRGRGRARLAIGCAPNASTAAPGRRRRRARADRRRLDVRHGTDACEAIPEETAGPVPGRRLQRAGRAVRERRRPRGHPLQLRRVHDARLRRPADDPPRDPRPRQRAARRSADAAVYAWHCDQAGSLLDVLRRRRRTRTTCAASRPPARTAS